MESRNEEEEVAAMLAALDAALDALRDRDDTRGKFKALKTLAEGLDDRAEQTWTNRRKVAARIYDKEKVALRPLADELGVSPTRLHQYVNEGKKDRKKESPHVRADDDLG